MFDNFLTQVRRGAGQLQRRGEEVAQGARLRLEVYQLGRELDGVYARLGRAYHAEADQSVLQDLRSEVRRLDEEISSRERLLGELADLSTPAPETGQTGTGSAESIRAAAARTHGPQASAAVELHKSGVGEANLGDLPDLGSATRPVPPSDAPQPPSTAAVIDNAPPFVARGEPSPAPPGAAAASHIWRSKEEQRMTDNSNQPPRSNNDDPVVANSDNKLVPGDETASTGNEAARDAVWRHKNTLQEGEAASRNPDPLDK